MNGGSKPPPCNVKFCFYADILFRKIDYFYRLSSMFAQARRVGACVKSNIVNNLCKDMVYTFQITILCIWKPNGA